MAASCQEIFEKIVPQKIKENPHLMRQMHGVFEFKIEGRPGGVWHVDCDQHPPAVHTGPQPNAQVFIEMREDDFLAYFEGRLGGFQAFIMGKIRIKGESDLALQMGEILKKVV